MEGRVPGGYVSYIRLIDQSHEGSDRGAEPMGIITWKHELLVVPFCGQWAA